MTLKKSLMLALVAGACCSATTLAQPVATDLGALTPGTPVTVAPAYAAATVVWYRFTIPAVSAPLYLDIDTRLPSVTADTEIGLYRADDVNPALSTLVSSDDDDGAGNLSALSFGACAPTRTGEVGAIVFNGRDGLALTAGTYYLAVGAFNMTFGAADYAVTSSGGVGSTTLQIRLDTAPGAAPPPSITAGASTPASAIAGSDILLTSTLAACGRDGSTVTVDLTAFGGSATTALTDDGLNGDVTANDGVYSVSVTIPALATVGGYNFIVTAANVGGSATRTIPVIVDGEGVAKAIRISQATGAGGLSATDAAFDYVELYNADVTAADLSGYSVQVATATGTTWQRVALPAGFTIQPGTYALIRLEAQSVTGIVPTRTPDVVSTTATNLGSTGGKIALVNTTTLLTGAVPVPPGNATFIDRLGYGTASAGFAETANRAAPASPNRILVRGCNGALDANNNSTDFGASAMSAGLPRNSTSPATLPGPGLSGVTATPAAGLPPYITTITATTTPCGAGTTIASVKINLSSIGGSPSATMLDNGLNGDGAAGDLVYGLANISVNAAPGVYQLPIRVVDSSSNITTGNATVTVVGIPATIIDFGDLSAPTAGTVTTDLAAGQIQWARFTLSQEASTATGLFVDIDTNNSSGCPDTEIAVYRADGTLVATNDDGSSGAESLLTFGAGGRPAVNDACGTDAGARNGFGGVLAPGTYYIAMGIFNSNFNATLFDVNGTGGAVTGVTLNISSIPPNTPPTGVGAAGPAPINELATINLAVTVTPGQNPVSTALTVQADLTSIGGSAGTTLFDDGLHNDGAAGDNVFGLDYTLPNSAAGAAGAKTVPFTVADAEGRSTNGNIAFTVIGVNGSCCVAADCSIQSAVACSLLGGTYTAGGTCGGPTAYDIAPGASVFEDISTTGVRLATVSECDDCGQVAPIGFNFNLYGTVQSSVWVCSNGFAQFGGGNSTIFSNTALPNIGTPNNIIAPLWDDYDTEELSTGAGDVYVLTDGAPGARRCVISWQGVRQFNTTPAQLSSFQIVLFEGTNRIEFRYGTLSDPTVNTDTSSATIGVENTDGTIASSYDVTLVVPGNVSLDVNVSTSVPSPCGCSTDVNGDGFTDPDDLSDAIACFFDPACVFDYDRSTFEDPDDLSTYISDFFTPGFCG